MKITDIKQQVKRADRYSVYIEGKYSFSLSEVELAKTGLHRDQEVSEAELETLRKTAELDKANDRSLRYLAIRPRSHWEIEQYLGRKGYDEDLIERVFTKLEPLGLVNDQQFARQWVEWRLNSGGRSKRQLRAELFKKHLSSEVIDEALATVDDEAELEQLKSLIERKRRLTQYQDRQKLTAYLSRRGYNYGLIKQALAED